MLEVTKHGGVARVTLNRPELRNAFDDELIQKLRGAFEDVSKDQSVRVMVLAGNGPAFCAGADLNWMKRMAKYGYAENLADAEALALMLAWACGPPASRCFTSISIVASSSVEETRAESIPMR